MLKYGLQNDLIFKYIFGHKKNNRILISLLNSILDLKGKKVIKEITILNPINLQEHKDDKLSIFDIKAKDETNKQYNIEMQLNVNKHYISRIIYHASRFFSEQLTKGKKYQNLEKTYIISILVNTLIKSETEIHNIYRLKNIKSGKELTDITEYHFIKLSKFKKEKPRKLRTKFEKWLNVLKYSTEYQSGKKEVPKELLEEEEIAMAMKELDKALADRRMLEILRSREKAELDHLSRLEEALQDGMKKGIRKGIRKGMQQGMQQGKEEGFIKAKEDDAKKMLKEGLSVQLISRITGLTQKRIKEL